MPESSIDYRALIQDRKAKQKRPIVRHLICLDPELFADLEELKAQQVEEIQRRYESDDDQPDKPAGDVRLAGGAPTLEQQISELEQRIGAVTVVGVFKAPHAHRQAELSAANRDEEATPVVSVVALILESFVGFERNREPIPAEQLGKADLADLLPELAQGELLALGNRIIDASAGAPDVPLSVRRSVLNRPYAAISKRR